ncbi:MAG TPA: tryptophan synthase subunit alpha [Gammaproteobacteria bacterium]|nr:tryptophan synthase subunit alpha [Gammaproteobacteria bacterium]
MSRIAARFTELKRAGRTALVPYLTAGDPGKQATVPLMHAMVAAGADALELGVPFSDPSADGPVIQAACERALAAGTTLKDVLAMVREFRTRDDVTPVILMGYLNPMEAMGAETFVAAAAEAGVDGVLTVDMPPEEAEPLAGLLRAEGMDPIFLLAPTTDAARIRRISETASGFIYYVSFKGVTGAARLDVAEVRERLALVRRSTTLPVGVGFGIRDAASAAALAGTADAIIVGSAIVSRIAEHRDDPTRAAAVLGAFVGELRSAVDAARRSTKSA